ncbi:MAG: ABC transporter substrate-binding protein [Proteobacteria bacterium]|nr:ABC transporter substrate-binding protein [Pseudomonadota bacterium]
MISRREIIGALGGTAIAWPLTARAQEPAKVARIGVLRPGALRDTSLDAFLRSLRELGYVESRNIVIEYRASEERADHLPALARELVALKVGVIVAEHSSAIQAAKQETRTIPIVMAASADPVGAGLVASLARPGGNVTGLSRLAPEAEEKRLELLKETLPKASRVAFLWDPANPGLTIRYKAGEVAARALGIELQSLEVRRPDQLRSALEAAVRERAGALIVPSPMVSAHRSRIVDLAGNKRLPLIYDTREFVDEVGVLMSYGSSLADSWRRAAIYVDKILKGANPSDLPVEQPTKFELVINLKTAKALGLTIPPSILVRADEVIE